MPDRADTALGILLPALTITGFLLVVVIGGPYLDLVLRR